MANEISAALSLSFTKNGVTESVNIATTKFTMNGNNYTHETFLVPMSAGGTAIPKGSIGTPGWAHFRNLDGSGNMVQILSGVNGSALAQFNGGFSGSTTGEFGMIRVASGATNLAAVAFTSSVYMDVFLIEN